jgi:N-acyl-D-amino-acid deacylase
MDAAIAKVEAARREGLKITADMYTYTASSTGLNACIPLWAQSGGAEEMRRRFRDPKERQKVLGEMTASTPSIENRVNAPDKILLVEFKNEKLKPLQGKTLAEVAKERGKSAAENSSGSNDGGRIARRCGLLHHVGR